MSYLCSQRDKGGANAYTIANRAGIPKQESNRFKGFLQELCDKKCIKFMSIETSNQERGRLIFQITEIGEKIIAAYYQHNFALILGPLNEDSEENTS